MTNILKTTALMTLIAAAPIAAFATPQTGSPEQSIAADPNEQADPVTTFSSSSTDTPLYDSFDEADVVESVNGSIHSGDAQRDE